MHFLQFQFKVKTTRARLNWFTSWDMYLQTLNVKKVVDKTGFVKLYVKLTDAQPNLRYKLCSSSARNYKGHNKNFKVL